MIRSLLFGALLISGLSCAGPQNRAATTPATARRADGAPPVAGAKPGEHQHGAEGQDKAGGQPMCPCMAGKHDAAAATK